MAAKMVTYTLLLLLGYVYLYTSHKTSKKTITSYIRTNKINITANMFEAFLAHDAAYWRINGGNKGTFGASL